MSGHCGEEQRQLRDLIRRVAAERVAPRAAEIDRTAEYPQDMFELLRSLGLFALPFPPAYGGSGSYLSAAIALEEFGRVCYNTAYLLLLQWAPFGAILAGGDAGQQARFLPALAAGALRGAIALTEPQGGSDVAGIRTRAVRCPGGYRLFGAKAWCTGAPLADFIVVAARIERGPLALFIVERGAPGLAIGRPEDKLGARGIPSCPLFLDDLFVPQENRVGPEESGFRTVMEALNQARPLIGARGVGLAQGAMELAIAFVKERRAFGRRIGDFQGVRWTIADMAIQVAAARHLVYRAAQAVDDGVTGKELASLAAIAKCHASDTAMRVATEAVQLFGAAGISNAVPINRYFRDAKVLQIVEGTNQIQRNLIARLLLGPEERGG
jgi:alkylation response protein AidB-like acyl-CoA dehydrogenase